MKLPAQEIYDKLAPDYDRRWSRYTEATLRATIDGLELRKGDRVLDVAAGTGELARRLLGRRPGLEIVGVDLSRAMLKRGLGKADLRSWEPIQGDATRLSLAGESFDAVLCTNAFHLFPRPAAALAEMRRVLRPSGLLTLTDWCDDFLTCKLCSLWVKMTDPSFQRAYTLRECCRSLGEAGFRLESARRFKIDWLWGLMRLLAR